MSGVEWNETDEIRSSSEYKGEENKSAYHNFKAYDCENILRYIQFITEIMRFISDDLSF
jgi:hypothetical protein